jgi:uncharacterized protein YifN (PemK superfamily)
VTKVTGKYVVVLNTGEKAHFQDMEMLVRYVLAYCPIGEVSKKELNKTTDKYGVLTNLKPTSHDTEILEAAFQTTGLLLFRVTAAI